MEKMKTFRFGVAWSMFGYQTVRVPVDMTEEEAMEYVQANWDKIPLPEGDYLQDSDEPDFTSAGFEPDENLSVVR